MEGYTMTKNISFFILISLLFSTQYASENQKTLNTIREQIATIFTDSCRTRPQQSITDRTKALEKLESQLKSLQSVNLSDKIIVEHLQKKVSETFSVLYHVVSLD